MKIFYSENYNIDLGLLGRLHPFDGKKFAHVFDAISKIESVEVVRPEGPVSQQDIDDFADALLRLLLRRKRYIFRALEIPYIPLLPYSFIDNHILAPMRWGVAGTVEAARTALAGETAWNLSGGYHHASRASSEGFCIYNDVGIAVDVLTRDGTLNGKSKILIIDVDAHHGNGNAYTFMENENVTILDIYNGAIYPQSDYARERVDINIPLEPGTSGALYLDRLDQGLRRLNDSYDLAFVIAGTDVLGADPLGGLKLTIQDCVERDSLILRTLSSLSAPAAFLGGGGYSRDSAMAISASIKALHAN